MSLQLKVFLIIVSLFLFISTLNLVRKQKISFKYSLLWIISSIILLFISLFPGLFNSITNLIGFQLSSNFVIAILIFFLLIITRQLTKIVSEQNKKITKLVQEVSILKNDKKE